ncbi:MAG: hypothetical protein K2Y12_03315 [Chitinophagaceae bacterium]|jgi:hypothetical protein|nr:hypothetical protein [Chitinophagaceae bacterium]
MQLSITRITKKAGIVCAFLLAMLSGNETKAQKGYEFTSFTVIESIIPSGLGRSRIIHALETRDYKEFSSVRSEDDNTRNKSDRDDIRVKNFEETKILNFFNLGGIRFQNIAANDAMVNSKVNGMMEDGWELLTITAGVESDAGEKDGNGIFITRFYFKRPKK